MIYLYILTKDGNLSDEANEEISKAYSGEVLRKPRFIGTSKVYTPENDVTNSDKKIPGELDDSAEDICIKALEESGVGFNPRYDEIEYHVHTVGRTEYGVCQVYTSRYVFLSPVIAGLIGFALGIGLGVTQLSVGLLAILFGAYLAYLVFAGKPRDKTETWLFASGPTLMMAWVAGFIVLGWIETPPGSL